MAKPNSRATLQDYCLRQLGAPILEINVADEQVDDLMDDSLQFFYERHFDVVEKVDLEVVVLVLVLLVHQLHLVYLKRMKVI